MMAFVLVFLCRRYRPLVPCLRELSWSGADPASVNCHRGLLQLSLLPSTVLKCCSYLFLYFWMSEVSFHSVKFSNVEHAYLS